MHVPAPPPLVFPFLSSVPLLHCAAFLFVLDQMSSISSHQEERQKLLHVSPCAAVACMCSPLGCLAAAFFLPSRRVPRRPDGPASAAGPSSIDIN
jgi:hypothetical protein